ncbi:Uu.00g100530.m01.CDS01 [Anthostomella pinea]|uniref:Uu.00g100530.m01.CDS01 n=1 Tax=Anthostomella pinea TaxID=933095 RepID=A0AAI8V7X6_9PEZI|nr:Uu.00g100530.m01.CDS01 [Anthostomella pinea]
MDGLNEYRRAHVAEVLSDFRTLQFHIAAAPTDPPNGADYQTEGWAALRQCGLDGLHILNCAADTSVPQTGAGGEVEQEKAELRQVLLDACARRHVAQKIYLRQAAAQRWVEYREQVLQGQRPNLSHRRLLRACDEHLRNELAQVTDDAVYQELQSSDLAMGRWIAEDPGLRQVQRWVRARPQTT